MEDGGWRMEDGFQAIRYPQSSILDRFHALLSLQAIDLHERDTCRAVFAAHNRGVIAGI